MTVVALLVVFVLVALGIMRSGLYNVAAIQSHSALGEWVLATTMDESVEYHASAVVVPADLDRMGPAEGAEHYAEMCVICHGAPGVERREFAERLNPQPPELRESATEMGPAELFWIIRNGVKMAAMPGFGKMHEDEHLWALAAFVHRLPDMTAGEYKSLTSARRESTDGSEHEHGHEEEGDQG